MILAEGCTVIMLSITAQSSVIIFLLSLERLDYCKFRKKIEATNATMSMCTLRRMALLEDICDLLCCC